MKHVIFLILVTLISGYTKAQQASLEIIECLGETIVTVQGKDVKSSSNAQNASIFTVNMDEKTLTIKSISRFYGIQQDEFVITKKTIVGGKDIYDIANPSTADKNKYGISIDNSNAVLNIFSGSKTITITSSIVKRYNEEILVKSEEPDFFFGAEFAYDDSGIFTKIDWLDKSDTICVQLKGTGEYQEPLCLKVLFVEKIDAGIKIHVVESEPLILNYNGTYKKDKFVEGNGCSIAQVINSIIETFPEKGTLE